MKLFAPILLACNLFNSAEAGIGRKVVEMVKTATDNNDKRLLTEWGIWKKTFEKTYETIEEDIVRYVFNVDVNR